MITGLLEPTEGAILFKGQRVRDELRESVALGWLLAFQSASSGLTPRPHPPGWPPEVSLLAAPLIDRLSAGAGLAAGI
jgi:hypothetical protein